MSEMKGDHNREAITWDVDQRKLVLGTKPDAKYGAVSESLRHTIPQATACTLFCGGRKCKYCSASQWRDDQMAVKGLYSHWVTDNILAMARPNNEGNEKYKFIEQFQDLGIKSIINLQTPGEHSSCGPPLDASGFSYNPQDFMDNDIFFYTFGWPDYDVGSLSNILDMVKVMQFALSEGKVAVHCHAGLGRTGVLIGVYLVFANRMDPHEAVHYIRSKRPGAIQTRTQVACIEEFAKYLKPFRVIFSQTAPHSYDFTLAQYLIRQRQLMHGFEARQLKNIPKVIFVVCERLLELAQRSHHRLPLLTFKVVQEPERPLLDQRGPWGPGQGQGGEHSPEMSGRPVRTSRSSCTLSSNCDKRSGRARSLTNLSTVGTNHHHQAPAPQHADRSPVLARRAGASYHQANLDADSIGHPSSHFFLGSDADLRGRAIPPMGAAGGDTPADLVAAMMAQTEYPADRTEQVESLKSLLNEDSATWLSLQDETDALILAKLMWDWLDHLKEPILSLQDMPDLLNHADEPLTALEQLDKGTRGTLEYLLGVVARLAPIDERLELELVQRMLSVLCHQHLAIDADLPLAMGTASANSALSSLRRTVNFGEMTSSLALRLTQFAYNVIHELQKKVEVINTQVGPEGDGSKKSDGKKKKKRPIRT